MMITFTPFQYTEHRIYDVNWDGARFSITVTATASVVRRWLQSTLYRNRASIFRGRLIVGLGVQWTPRAADADPPADTLQLCIGSRCLVFQLSRAEHVPPLLRLLLLSPSCIFVGFRNVSDRRKLMVSVHSLYLRRFPLDLRFLVNAYLANASLETIVETCLGFRGVQLRREVSMSDWSAETLSDDQVLQASIVAHCAFLIGTYFLTWL